MTNKTKSHSVMDIKANNMALPFFGDSVSIQRFDVVAWADIQKWNQKGLSQFWVPEEVDVTKDKGDFESLPANEQHTFVSNIKRQILLDSIQGRAPVEAFMPIASTPEMEFAVLEWTRQEAIHSLSYTHILRNIYNDPSVVFDTVLEIEEIVNCATDITKYYDAAIRFSGRVLAGDEFTDEERYEHKKAFWRAIFCANALEGVRFYVSFACSWAFMETRQKMEGNAKVIRLIARDEADHLQLTQKILNRLPGMDPDFLKIREECRAEMTQLYVDVAEQEKEWAKYLFKEGSMLGMNYEILCSYVDYMAGIRMSAIGHPYPGNVVKTNPLPWISKWLINGNMQYALQEAEASDYLHGVLSGSVDEGLQDRRIKHF